MLASCGTDPPPGRTVAPWEPSNRDQPRAAFPSHPTSRPAAATLRPGLGSDRTKLQVLGRPQIWPTSTSAKSGQSRHPLIVTSRFISITRRRFHHDNHSSFLTGARPATFSGSLPLFNPSTASPRFTHSPPISPLVCFTHIYFPFHCAPSHRPANRTARSLGYRLHRCATRTHDALALHHGTGPALSSHL